MTKQFTGVLAAAFGIFISASALAQTVAPAAVAGQWLYDAQGHTIGSVIGAAEGGQSAEIMIGSYFQPGSHKAVVPAASLSVDGGKVILQAQTAQALNLPVRR